MWHKSLVHLHILNLVSILQARDSGHEARWKQVGDHEGHFAPEAGLETPKWYRLGDRWSRMRTYGRCRHRLICIVNVHDHVFRIIGDIVYVCDNISDDVGTDFLSFWVVMLRMA